MALCHAVAPYQNAPSRFSSHTSTLFKIRRPDAYLYLDFPYLTATSLLAPIGRQRSATASSSRDGATRGSSRKRKHNAIPAAPQQQRTIATSFTVGLNSTTRYLSELAARSAPASTKSKQPVGDVTGQTEVDLQPGTEPLAAIFLPKSASPILYAHFPLLALAASSAYPSQPLTRLVPLPASAEKKLAAALGIPRAGVIGVKDVEEAKSLLVFVREHVPIVEVPWLAESKDGKWMGTKIVDGR